jgi:hypothetical protein
MQILRTRKKRAGKTAIFFQAPIKPPAKQQSWRRKSLARKE